MNNHLNKNFLLVIFIPFLILLTSSYFIYKNEVMNIQKEINNKLLINSNLLKENFSITNSLLFSLRNSLETKLELSLHSSIYHPAYESIQFTNKSNTFHITDTYCRKIDNILIGLGNINSIDEDKKDEIYAALSLSPLFKTIMEIIPETKWVYYTSKDDFIFISPFCNLNVFNSFEEIYSLDFWKDAIPKNNPTHKLVISDIYKDVAGKGLMITLSLPVLSHDEFKGVVSIDIGVDTLKEYFIEANTLSEVYLISENNNILISNSSSKTIGNINLNKNTNKKIEIIKDELYLINVQNPSEINEKAIFQAFWKIFILFLVFALIIIVIYLKKVLSKVEYLAKTDSLTKLLNRRTLESEIKSLINISNRHKQNLSFLLIDIDFFKKINDTFGHQIGDEVLIEISKLFIKNTRDYDVIGRYGGEEFLIALANTNIKDAFILAERIREHAKLIKVGKLNIKLTISIGCSQLKENDTYFKILKRVDTLLYEAKKRGRDITIKEEEN